MSGFVVGTTNQRREKLDTWKWLTASISCHGSPSKTSPLRNLELKRRARWALCALACVIAAALLQSEALGAGGDLLWKTRLDGTSLNAIAAKGKRVFVGGVNNAIGQWIVQTYDVRNGNPIWQDKFNFENAATVVNGIAAARRRVYVAGQGNSTDNKSVWLVRAYDSKTGVVLWEDQFIGDNGAFANAVAVEGGRVFVAGGIAHSDNAGVFDWFVKAYDAKDGSLLWDDRVGLEGQFEMATAIAVRGSRVFIGGGGLAGQEFSGNWLVRTYRTSDGALLWEDRFDLGGHFGQARAISARKGQVFVAGRALRDAGHADWVLRSHDLKTGTLLWQDSFDVGLAGLAAQAIAGKGKQLSVAGGAELSGDKWIVKTYDRKSGSTIWQDEFEAAYGAGALTIARRGSRVFAAGCQGSPNFGTVCGNGLIRSYDARTGTQLWEDVFNVGSVSDHTYVSTTRGNRVIIGGFLTDVQQGFVRAYQAK